MRRLTGPILALLIAASSSPWAREQRETRPVGFSGSEAATQLALEAEFAAGLDPANLRSRLRELSAKPHHPGSPEARRVAESLAAMFRSWGFDTQIEVFYALMPTPKARNVEMTAPHQYRASLIEPAVAGHVPPQPEGSLPPYSAYSRDGAVSATAVYVNYGTAEDYALLARHGLDVEGKIVLARFGGAFRGIKPRLAAERGAVGTILFSDPADYGYRLGVPYPDGPFLPNRGYQRGSVMDLTRFTGDPLTPGHGATRKPRSFSLEDASDVLAPVPVLPLSAEDVLPILQAMQGPVAPPAWQGALPITYRLGGNVEIRLEVEQAWDVVPLHNVVARLEGSEWPDEWVLRGNNHDAWNYGAMVPLSGLVTLLEEARSIGQLARSGWRPKRSMVYLAWDGEELGLMGSTEWAETHAAELQAKAVSYLNTGITTRGYFAAGGSHALEALVNDVAKLVRDPDHGVPAYDRAAALVHVHGDPAQRDDLARNGRLRLTPLGIGSDWTPFLQHLGIPSLDFAFEGEAESGVYHSSYDTFAFFDQLMDSDYSYGVALAEASGRTMLRLANAPLLPFDFTGMGDAIARYALEIETLLDEMRRNNEIVNEHIEQGRYALISDLRLELAPPEKRLQVPKLDLASLEEATARLQSSARRFSAARDAFELSSSRMDDAALVRVNSILRKAEQQLAPARGLPRRPWYRHHIYAPGHDTGYGVKTLPGIREAVERHDWHEANLQIVVAAKLIDAYAGEIDRASAIVEVVH